MKPTTPKTELQPSTQLRKAVFGGALSNQTRSAPFPTAGASTGGRRRNSPERQFGCVAGASCAARQMLLVLVLALCSALAGLGAPPTQAPKEGDPPAKAQKVRLRVAGAQIPVVRDVRKNVEAITRALEFAAREKADVLVTPEGSLSGYSHDFDAQVTAQALEEVVRTARAANVALVLGTCFAEADGARYDQQRFYDRDGNYQGFHAKILLCRRVADPTAKGEIDFFKSKPLRTFTLQGLPVGGLVCNDMWANPEWTPMDDPRLAQKLAGMGARVIFLSVNSGQAEGDELALNRAFHESNLRLRARSANLWMVVADAGDPQGQRAANCPSGVLSPEGRWVVQVESKGEQFFAHTIELEEADHQRSPP